MRHTKRIQILLSPTQMSAFQEVAGRIYPPRHRFGEPRANESVAGRQAILEWISNHAQDKPRNEGA